MYTIKLTDHQLSLVLNAVELMARTGMGQSDDLTEWLSTRGNNITFDTSTEEGKREFEQYITVRDTISPMLEGMMTGCGLKGYQNKKKSKDTLNLETIYSAIRHQMWCDSKETQDWDVRSLQPIQWGSEPIPVIQKEEEG